MDEPVLPDTPEGLAKRLKWLHEERKRLRLPHIRRKPLTRQERAEVLGKTAKRCHICGGEIETNDWPADHIRPHASGGEQSIDNLLAAHRLCNGKRWFYSAEEFQWILKIGVWARKQIEDETPIGKEMVAPFWQHELRAIIRRAGDSPSGQDAT